MPTQSPAIARAVSLLAHPLPVVTLTLLMLLQRHAVPASVLWLAAGVSVALGVLVIALSRHHVRQGHWQHVDASQPTERRQLNRSLLVLFSLGTAASVIGRSGLAAAVFAGALLIVLLAMAVQRWGKASLHMAFAVFAAVLLQPASPAAILAVVAALLAIGWSRLHLQRHVPIDLLLGATSGALAAVLAQGLRSAMEG